MDILLHFLMHNKKSFNTSIYNTLENEILISVCKAKLVLYKTLKFDFTYDLIDNKMLKLIWTKRMFFDEKNGYKYKKILYKFTKSDSCGFQINLWMGNFLFVQNKLALKHVNVFYQQQEQTKFLTIVSRTNKMIFNIHICLRLKGEN